MQLFHPLDGSKSEKPALFNNPFYYEADGLCKAASSCVVDYIERADSSFREEARKGKMFGVLVAENQKNETGFLAAFSGQINASLGNGYFVPAIFDYLGKDGFFKTREREISDISREISEIEKSETKKRLEQDARMMRIQAEISIEEAKARCGEAKLRRDEIRSRGNVSPETEQLLIRESQFLKAELHRAKQKAKAWISQSENALEAWEQSVRSLKSKRKLESDNLQRWLFSQMEIVNSLGERKSVLEIFSGFNGSVPPSGSGECCAPKLLQYAFLHGLRPVSMAEFWYGESPKQEIRRHLNFYPACQGKCKPILNFMLKGLSCPANPLETGKKDDIGIVYEDDAVIAICKPAGMLSVPGKGSLKSAYDIVRERFPDQEIWICHRLDMATSGLLIFAKSKAFYEIIHKQFADHTVKKRYVAILEGRIAEKRGKICLPLSADISDRPRQMVDRISGKLAVTEFEVIGEQEGKSRLYLFPHTGRTHQLRVHCAHPEGLSTPILGDELYGKKSGRLYLHAERIAFTHPVSGKRIAVEKAADF